MINEDVPKLDKWFMTLTVIDILFMPYFFVVTITYTFFFSIWYFYKHMAEIMEDNSDYRYFRIMCFLMVTSAMVGIAMDVSTAKDNFVFTFQFIVSFMHLYVFKYYLDRYHFELKGYLIGFVLFVVAVALLFNFNRGLYYDVRGIWSPVQNRALMSSNSFDFESIGRFGFLWMDENNIAYVLNSVVLFLICNERLSFSEKIFVVVCDLFVLISTMSRGGLYTFYVGAALYGLLYVSRNRVIRTVGSKSKAFSVILFIILGIAIFKYAPQFLNSDVGQASKERLETQDDSRKRIYTYIIQNTNFIEYAIVGHGARTMINGQTVKPHNIHLYYILVYGIIAWAMMIYILFRKRKVTSWMEYIWIVPFFMGASANIIIGEEKAMCIAMLLIAASSSPKYLEERYDHYE